jgi:hypothetical protein
MKAKNVLFATHREEIYCPQCLEEIYECNRCHGIFIEGQRILCKDGKHTHVRCKSEVQ